MVAGRQTDRVPAAAGSAVRRSSPRRGAAAGLPDAEPRRSRSGGRRRPGARRGARRSRRAAAAPQPPAPAGQRTSRLQRSTAAGGSGSAGGRQGGRGGRGGGGGSAQAAGRRTARESARPVSRHVAGRPHARADDRRCRDRRGAAKSGIRAATIALFGNLNNIQWAGDHVVFPIADQQGNDDESQRYYSLSVTGARARAGPADDDRRHHRRRDGRRALEGRQDVLLLHEYRRHRSPAHLGGADGRRHAGADHDRATGIENVPAPLASASRSRC